MDHASRSLWSDLWTDNPVMRSEVLWTFGGILLGLLVVAGGSLYLLRRPHAAPSPRHSASSPVLEYAPAPAPRTWPVPFFVGLSVGILIGFVANVTTIELILRALGLPVH